MHGPTRHVSVLSHVGALFHISGQRNKRSRHGSVVLHSSHAAANKQITGLCRFYVSPLPFDIACANHSDGLHTARKSCAKKHLQ